MNAANAHIYKHLHPFERWLLECRTRSAARHYRELDAWMDEGNGLEDGSNDEQQRQTV